MRALRPRSPRATTTALIGKKRGDGVDILRRFAERPLEEPNHRHGVAAKARPIQVGFENRGVNIRLAAHGLRVPETVRDTFDGTNDVPFGFRLRFEIAAML